VDNWLVTFGDKHHSHFVAFFGFKNFASDLLSIERTEGVNCDFFAFVKRDIGKHSSLPNAVALGHADKPMLMAESGNSIFFIRAVASHGVYPCWDVDKIAFHRMVSF
jgi:hypothetical protein